MAKTPLEKVNEIMIKLTIKEQKDLLLDAGNSLYDRIEQEKKGKQDEINELSEQQKLIPKKEG